jgi:hypothetical protein
MSPDTFPPNSRYRLVETARLELGEGREIVYLRRRFAPQPESLALVGEHVVDQGERLDNIAAETIGDPEQFWRICDANRALLPEELTTTIGRRLRITLPDGVPGAPPA